VLEIQLAVAFEGGGTNRHAKVTARERHLCSIRGMSGYLHESCDGRHVAVGQIPPEGESKPGIVVMDAQSGAAERLCDIPEGVEWHGHLQWSMTNPYWLSFAGAPYRLWVVDTRDRKPWCPYKEFPDELVTHEKEMIEVALAQSRGRVSGPTGAAAKLSIPPSTLESKIRSLKINKHRFKHA
jgi:hypothetical protein